ncbi:hypothetical protein [Nonomuraea longicatena]|uniref:Uncharacterized protein n=1 Tax=Nonomuraea longicatena TaxID=83682 RepID=A0ABP3Z4J3_9ACTN
MRFPSRLLAATTVIFLASWAAFTVVLVAVTLAVHFFGDLTHSAWEAAATVPRWYMVINGAMLIHSFLPLYIAHGQTRRQFGAQAAVAALVFVPLVSVAMTLGYLLESGLYALLDRPQVLRQSHLFTEPSQVHLVLLEYVVEYLACFAAGMFMGAGFYRWSAGGLLTIPFGVGLIVLGLSAAGSDFSLPLSSFALGLDLPRGPGFAALTAVVAFSVGLALTWGVIRDVPLRNKV